MAFPPQEALSGPVSEEDLVALSCSVCGRERSQTLFCVSDLQPVCVECGDSEDHEDHRFRPIVEAAQELRQELDQSLLPLKEELEKAKDFQEMLLVIADCVKKQSHQTKRQIQDQFNKMHQFLEEEEEARLKALTEEDEQKIQKMKDKMDGCEQRDRSSYKAAVERVQRCPLLEEPQLGPGALIDQAKHLGNLAFNVWSSMKTMVHFSPVIMDPNRSTSEIVLSDDLTSFTTEKQRGPNAAGTETGWALVLGSEGFDCGSWSWSVEVGNSGEWAVGVVTDSLEEEDVEGWSVALSEGEYAAVQNEEHLTSLQLQSNPVRIRVRLDCDRHDVSFYDADANTHIHSFTHISPNKLFPYFGSTNKYKIKIEPEDVTLV
ncbi:E3 ubiquitin-protein ligase TRIM35-like [Boleophthalmus pectinirostris]|uniref:E3 ubiquitin-protein ligase TRIM35-like n=1 Tax=Boleophthalmus pectinirostris TaxID=150288 RepID=UPI00242DF6CB|nr:E3 ubiquitin-protein ligase TRIM35-like [Boleophthalmus pectinirostris]